MPAFLPAWRRRSAFAEGRRKSMQALREVTRRILGASASAAPRGPAEPAPPSAATAHQPRLGPLETRRLGLDGLRQVRRVVPGAHPASAEGLNLDSAITLASEGITLDSAIEATLRELAAATSLFANTETTLVIVQRSGDVFAFIVPLNPSDMSLDHLTRIRVAVSRFPIEDEETGLTQEQIRAIPRRCLATDPNANPDAYSSELACTICLSDYEKGDYLRDLACCHAFHQDCIDSWLLLNNSCPLCKAPPSAVDTEPT